MTAVPAKTRWRMLRRHTARAPIVMALAVLALSAVFQVAAAGSEKTWIRACMQRLAGIRPILSDYPGPIKGTVRLVLRIEIDRYGTITGVGVAKSSGLPLLDAGAVKLVMLLRELPTPPRSASPPIVLYLPLIMHPRPAKRPS